MSVASIYDGVVFNNSFAMSNYLHVDVLDNDNYFYSNSYADSLNLAPVEESMDFDAVQLTDDGFSTDLITVRRKVLNLLKCDQLEVNTILLLCDHFKIDRFKHNFQGLFVMLIDTCPDRVRDVIAGAVMPELVAPIPVVDAVVDDGMGFVALGRTGLFEFSGRAYGVSEKRYEWNDRVLDDYFSWLDFRKLDVSVRAFGYDDPLVTAKWIKWTNVIAGEMGRILPMGKRYYLPGDGLGIYSHVLKKLNHNVFSSEPNNNGEIARLLGLIDSDRPFNRKLDDGVTVLLAFNLGFKIYSAWSGPFVSWEQDMSCTIGALVPDTGGRLRVRGLSLLTTAMLDGPGVKFVSRVRKRLTAACKKKHQLGDVVNVTDLSMLDLVKKAGFVPSSIFNPDLVTVGRGQFEIDVHRLQDKKTCNDDLEFYCNLGDVIYYDDIEFKVRRFGMMLLISPKGFQRVQILRREHTMMKVFMDGGNLYVNSLSIRTGIFEAIYRGRRMFVQAVSEESEMQGFKILVQLVGFKYVSADRVRMGD